MIDNSNKPPKYHAAEFLVPVSDQFGQNERVQVRMSPQLEHAIGSAIASRMFPYKFPADLIRHAVMRHLSWLQSLEPDLPVQTHLVQMDAINTMLTELEMIENFSAFSTRSHKLIAQILSSGDEASKRKATKLAADVRSHINQIPDDYYRDKILKEWDRQYGYLLTDGGSVLPEIGEGD